MEYWIAGLTFAGLIVAVVADIIRASRGNKNLKDTLQGEHKALSKEHEGLSGEHDSIKELIAKEDGVLPTMKENFDKVKSTLFSIDKHLSVESAKKELVDKSLDDNQKDLKKSIEAISETFAEVEKLQIKVKALEIENASLKRELSQQRDIDKMNRSHDFNFEPEL